MSFFRLENLLSGNETTEVNIMAGSISKFRHDEIGRECSMECGEFKEWKHFHNSNAPSAIKNKASGCKSCHKRTITAHCSLDMRLAGDFLKYGFLT